MRLFSDKYANCLDCHGSFRLNKDSYPYIATDNGMQPSQSKDCPHCGSTRGWHSIDEPPIESGRILPPTPEKPKRSGKP